MKGSKGTEVPGTVETPSQCSDLADQASTSGALGHDLDLDAAQSPAALAEAAETEAITAEKAAAAARARAARLRAEAATARVEDPITGAAGEEPSCEEDSDATTNDPLAPATRRGLRIPRPRWKHAIAATIGLSTAALITVSGWMVYQDHMMSAQLHRRAEYAAAARQSLITLMSIDYTHVQQDVQRIIDNSTGSFKDEFQRQASDMAKVAQESRVVTDVTVNQAAVETMSQDTATVLVAATSRVTNAAGAKQEARAWRVTVDLRRDGGQIKMEKVELVP
jgi:Mce-associated membrane protein